MFSTGTSWVQQKAAKVAMNSGISTHYQPQLVRSLVWISSHHWEWQFQSTTSMNAPSKNSGDTGGIYWRMLGILEVYHKKTNISQPGSLFECKCYRGIERILPSSESKKKIWIGLFMIKIQTLVRKQKILVIKLEDALWNFLYHGWFRSFLRRRRREMHAEFCSGTWLLYRKKIKGNQSVARWWFQIFFIFTPIWRRFPFWLIFFRWVETINQVVFYHFVKHDLYRSEEKTHILWWIGAFKKMNRSRQGEATSLYRSRCWSLLPWWNIILLSKRDPVKQTTALAHSSCRYCCYLGGEKKGRSNSGPFTTCSKQASIARALKCAGGGCWCGHDAALQVPGWTIGEEGGYPSYIPNEHIYTYLHIFRYFFFLAFVVQTAFLLALSHFYKSRTFFLFAK